MAETLTKQEWEAAMAVILASKEAPKGKDDGDDDDKKGKDGKKMPPEFFSKKFAKKPAKDLLTEIPAGGGFQPKTGKPEPKETKLNEIPNNHPPAAGAPRLSNDKPVDDEIPAGGGFQVQVGKPESKETKLNEIPNNHPAGSGASRTPAQWASGGINYGSDTSAGWSGPKQPLVPSGKTVWGQPLPPAKTADQSSLPADGKTVNVSTDGVKSGKAVRTSMASENADSDLGHGPEGHGPLSMPDGSFNIVQPGDLHAAIAKVQNAEKSTTHAPGHAAYVDVKRHIARRATAMGLGHEVPADWQMMMAMKAEAEIARKFDTDTRKKMAGEGAALPDGSYPIADMEDLHNAIQAFGRSNPGDRAKVKAHIAKRARALGAGAEVLKHISSLGNAGK